MSSCQALPCCDAELSDPLMGASPRVWDEKQAVTLRTRSVEEVREIVQRMRADLWSDTEGGRLKLPIDKTFPLDQAAAALAHMRANKHFGKIVLVT